MANQGSLRGRKTASSITERSNTRSIRVDLEAVKTRVRANLSEIIGFDPRELIRAVGSPLCQKCRKFLHYKSIAEAIPEDDGVLLVVIPWSAFHQTLTIRGAAEICGATRILLEQKLYLLEEFESDILIPTITSDPIVGGGGGGVVAKSLSYTMDRSELTDEIRRTAELIGFPLSLSSIHKGVVSEAVIIQGEWWCPHCAVGCHVDVKLFDYGLQVDGLHHHPAITTYQVFSQSLNELGKAMKILPPQIKVLIVTQFNRLFELISETTLLHRNWCSGWEELSYAERYMARLIPLAMSRLARVQVQLADLSLLNREERDATNTIVQNFGPGCSIAWLEDSYIVTDLRSEFHVHLEYEGVSSLLATKSMAVLDCDLLPSLSGDLLLDILQMRSALHN